MQNTNFTTPLLYEKITIPVSGLVDSLQFHNDSHLSKVDSNEPLRQVQQLICSIGTEESAFGIVEKRQSAQRSDRLHSFQMLNDDSPNSLLTKPKGYSFNVVESSIVDSRFETHTTKVGDEDIGGSSQIVYLGSDLDYTTQYPKNSHLFLSDPDVEESTGYVGNISQRIKMKPSFKHNLSC
jgi:hypothetical protein